MEYINKETLVTIETDSKLAGDWVPISEFKEEYRLTVPEIKEKLDECKVDLFALLSYSTPNSSSFSLISGTVRRYRC